MFKNKYLLWTIIIAILTFVLTIIDIPVAKHNDTKGFIQYLDDKIPQYMLKFDVGATAIGLIHNGEIICLKGYGYSDEQKVKPVTEDTFFQAGSVSKSVTACGIMKLAEEKKIELEAPVLRYLKRWKLPQSKFNTGDVTIRRLLSHTAGIADVGGGYAGFLPGKTPQSLVESLISANDANNESVRLVYQPGTKHGYSGGGYTMLQLLIEDVSGQSFNTYMKNEILMPAKMDQSSFVLTPEIERNLSVVYNVSNEIAPARIFTAKAAAGLYTTARDLSSWLLALLEPHNTRNFLKHETINEMFISQPETNDIFPNGLSFSVSKMWFKKIEEVYHSGINLPGWCSIVTMLPAKKDGLVILTNHYGGTAIIHKLRSAWLIWETGSSGNNPLRIQKLVNILKSVLPIGLSGYLLLMIISVVRKKKMV